MLRNYLKIAFRNLQRNKVYSFINIAGLAVGMAISMLIMLFVLHEISFDKFHANGDRLYKVNSKVKYGDQEVNIDAMPYKLGASMKTNSVDIQDFARTKDIGEVIFKNPSEPTQIISESGITFADASYLSIFSFPLKVGDKNLALKNPFSMVISEEMADKYFYNQNPIGKTLLVNGKHIFSITGVLKNTPSNSSIKHFFLASLETFPKMSKENQEITDKAGAFNTYFLLKSEQSVSRVEQFIKKNEKLSGVFDTNAKYSLAQVSSTHLSGGFSHNINARYVYIFSAIALLILFLALFNYTSLTTARATLRSKEVGIRKVVGAGRSGLIRQFYVESIFLCFIAFGLAFLFLELLKPFFFNLIEVQIDESFTSSFYFLVVIAVLFITITLLAGSYPALLLSRFLPVEVIKGKFTSGQGGATVRKLFIVSQFTVSVVLMICTFIIVKQTKYMKSMDLGFVKDQVLAIPLDVSLGNHYQNIKNEIKTMSGVKALTSTTIPFYRGYSTWFTQSLKSKKEVMLAFINTDADFFSTIELKWLKPPTDKLKKGQIYINETAAQQLEIDKEFTGKSVDLGNTKREVGGILKDFHYSNVQSKIAPLMINVYNTDAKDWMQGGSPTLYVRFEDKIDLQEKIANIKYIFGKFPTQKPFEYYFLDDEFNKTFSNELRLSDMLMWFTSLAIFIACLGLFGLVAFTAETRTKEIGIRKVLGASVVSITALLSKDFLKLVLIAIVIASPIAYYFMQKWLQDFAYRIEISWWIFAVAGAISLLIALLTVSYQAIKAALMNPVKSLRTE
jgi:putative ABC transport system permease protein